MRRQIVEMATEAGEGHIPSALSILDILWVLYAEVLTKRQLAGSERDRFVLSKGHGSLALYVVLAAMGRIDRRTLMTFCDYNSDLGGHPDRTKVEGVEASTGSLGHGLPLSIGLALGEKILKSNGIIYVLIGDGESNEGTTWESALLASQHNLDNLVCIVDHNHSTDRALRIDPLPEKFQAFGWDTVVVDGHSPADLVAALTRISEKPLAVIAETVKGYGVSAMENNPAWHHGAPTREQCKDFLSGLS